MRSWHVTWSSEGRHPIAPDEGVRRRLASAIPRVGGAAVALFCVVDDHIHVVLFCAADERGRLVTALTLAFRPLVASPLASAFVRPVRDRGHLQWLADEYIFTQAAKHGLAPHPALWSGSCFADLAGARVLPGWYFVLDEARPRWRLRAAHVALGLPERRVEPAGDDAVRRAGAARLVAAAAFAACADPMLRGRGAPEVAARRVVAAIAQEVGIPNTEVAWALGITRIAAARLPKRAADGALARATRVRIALEDVVAVNPWVAREPDAPGYFAGDEADPS